MIISEESRQFKDKYFPNASDDDWNDWHWQLKNSFTKIEKLSNIYTLTIDENLIDQENTNIPFKTTPYYAQLLKYSEIRKTIIPTIKQLDYCDEESTDSLGEEADSVTKNLVHRYLDRVLFLTTNNCGSNCQFCTRSRTVSEHSLTYTNEDFEKSFKYIEEHLEIRDVLFSGGDILTMSDSFIEKLLKRARSIKHLEIIRIGSKAPVTFPQRITKEFIKMLKKYSPIYMNVHFTHPSEITPEVKESCLLLADNGIILGSQTVFLKDVNNNTETLKDLFRELTAIKIKPYYVYYPDYVTGTKYFRSSIQEMIEIQKEILGKISGFCIPNFVIDTKDGNGKVRMMPNFTTIKENIIEIECFNGNKVEYKI